MKKLIILLFFPLCSFAQLGLLNGKNVVKTNVFGVAINNYNLIYERAFMKKFSFSLGVRHMPKTGVPSQLKDRIEGMVNNKDFNIQDFKMGNTAITGEFRYYPKKALKGFYLAPYVRYATFDMTFPVNNPVAGATGPVLLEGKIKSTSLGLMIGTQHTIGKHFVIDFWILGGHYGTSKGTLTATNIQPTMTQADQDLLTSTIADVTKDVEGFKIQGRATGPNSAELKTSGPWVGIRSLALTLGVKF